MSGPFYTHLIDAQFMRGCHNLKSIDENTGEWESECNMWFLHGCFTMFLVQTPLPISCFQVCVCLCVCCVFVSVRVCVCVWGASMCVFKFSSGEGQGQNSSEPLFFIFLSVPFEVWFASACARIWFLGELVRDSRKIYFPTVPSLASTEIKMAGPLLGHVHNRILTMVTKRFRPKIANILKQQFAMLP